MKRLFSILLTAVLLLSVLPYAYAAPKPYYLEEYGFQIILPDTASVVTLDTPADDPAWNDFDGYALASQSMQESEQALQAIDLQHGYYYSIAVSSGSYLNLSLVGNDLMLGVREVFRDDALIDTLRTDDIYYHPQATFIYLDGLVTISNDDGASVECWYGEYSTIHHGQYILISIFNLWDASPAEAKAALDLVAKNIHFDEPDYTVETAPEFTPPTTYEHRPSDAVFPIPRNWMFTASGQNFQELQSALIPAYTIKITAERWDQPFTTQEMKKLTGYPENYMEAEKIILGEKNFILVRCGHQLDDYLYAWPDYTHSFLYTLHNGWLYTLSFPDGTDAPLYHDMEYMAANLTLAEPAPTPEPEPEPAPAPEPEIPPASPPEDVPPADHASLILILIPVVIFLLVALAFAAERFLHKKRAKRCPHCGHILTGSHTNCPDCGLFIRRDQDR